MRQEIRIGYQKFRNDGITQVLRAGSRLVNRKYYDWRSGADYNREGVDIHDEDWDNLIILDACRYDYFERYCNIAGELEHRISRGSTTKEFIRGNFADRREYDTVYLYDNPWYGRLHGEIDSDLYHFSFCERDAFGGTVSYPATVTQSAIDYNERYPNKRLIVHYMQPHAPYFTIEGRERFRWPSENRNDCDPALLKDAYVTNLRLVLSEVKELLGHLVGKTVITADHGELLGERLPPFPLRQYSHPGGIYVEELVKVPWLVVGGDKRKEIIEEESSAETSLGDSYEDDVDEQLKALGYQ